MRVVFNNKVFQRDMRNLIEYSAGYVDGIQRGKKVFLNNLGIGVIEALSQYIDTNARMSPSTLHHVYEWYQTGSPSARLFDIDYTVSNLGLSLNSKFRQSSTISKDGNKPFYDKARIMEEGVPVTISPKQGGSLRFNLSGREVFTKTPVTVYNPGGDEVQGSFENVIDQFIIRYFKQSFLKASGIYNYISKPTLYKKNIKAGVKSGRGVGVRTGFTWIANAAIGVKPND